MELCFGSRMSRQKHLLTMQRFLLRSGGPRGCGFDRAPRSGRSGISAIDAVCISLQRPTQALGLHFLLSGDCLSQKFLL